VCDTTPGRALPDGVRAPEGGSDSVPVLRGGDSHVHALGQARCGMRLIDGRARVEPYSPQGVDQRAIKLDEVRGAHYVIEGRAYAQVLNRRELEINLVSVGRTGGRVDRVAVSGVDREVIDQRPVLRYRDAELQKPFIDGDSVVDGDDPIVATGQLTRQFGRIRSILQRLRAMLGSSIDRDRLARPRRDESISTE